MPSDRAILKLFVMISLLRVWVSGKTCGKSLWFVAQHRQGFGQSKASAKHIDHTQYLRAFATGATSRWPLPMGRLLLSAK